MIPSHNKERRELQDGWSSGCDQLVRQAVLELHGRFVCVIQMTCPRASPTPACTGLPRGHQRDARRSPADRSNRRQVKVKEQFVRRTSDQNRRNPKVFTMLLIGSAYYSLTLDIFPFTDG